MTAGPTEGDVDHFIPVRTLADLTAHERMLVLVHVKFDALGRLSGCSLHRWETTTHTHTDTSTHSIEMEGVAAYVAGTSAQMTSSSAPSSRCR